MRFATHQAGRRSYDECRTDRSVHWCRGVGTDCDQGTFPDELTRVESRDLRDAHEMFLGAPGPPLTEAVRQ